MQQLVNCLGVADRNGTLHITITDNGKGFDIHARTTHLRLVGLRERANYLNGSPVISSVPGKGTRVHLMIPEYRKARYDNSI